MFVKRAVNICKADIAEKGAGDSWEKLKINHSQETLQTSVDLNREVLFLIYFDDKQRHCSSVPHLYLQMQYQSVNSEYLNNN